MKTMTWVTAEKKAKAGELNMEKTTYFDFINGLPENATVVLRNGEELSKSKFLVQFESFTGNDAKKTFMSGCEFVIRFGRVN